MLRSECTKGHAPKRQALVWGGYLKEDCAGERCTYISRGYQWN